MCLILFAYRVHPVYRLVVAANRDESYTRPTTPAHYWDDHPEVLAGRDLLKKGTWMGVSRSGRFAALTNVRQPKTDDEGNRSRGELAAAFLAGTELPKPYMRRAFHSRDLYPGYNLLAGDRYELYYYSNRGGPPVRLGPGVYGVSNHLLNTEWPKVRRGKEALEALMAGTPGDVLENELLRLLRHSEIAPDDELPDTGIPLELERILSPLFIRSDTYGTRSSTVMLMGDQSIRYTERVYQENGTADQTFIVQSAAR